MDPIQQAKEALDKELEALNQDINKESENDSEGEQEQPTGEQGINKEPEEDKGDEFEEFDPFKEISEEEDNKGDEDEIDDQDKEVINKVLTKRLGPVEEQLRNTAIDNQVDTILNSPEGVHLKPFEAKIKTIAKDKRTAGYTMEAIISQAVGYKNLIRLGAKIAKEADRKGKDSAGGSYGIPNTSEAGAVDLDKMSGKDVLAMAEKIKQRG